MSVQGVNMVNDWATQIVMDDLSSKTRRNIQNAGARTGDATPADISAVCGDLIQKLANQQRDRINNMGENPSYKEMLQIQSQNKSDESRSDILKKINDIGEKMADISVRKNQ